MNYSKLKPSEQKRFQIAGFNGGIASGVSALKKDNRLADARNLWWQDGALRTRPGFKMLPDSYCPTAGKAVAKTVGGSSDFYEDVQLKRRLARIFQRQEDAVTVYDAVLSAVSYDGAERRSTIFSGVCSDEFSGLMLAEGGSGKYDGTAANCAVAFVGKEGSSSGCKILAEPVAPDFPWADITEEAYVPLVMINGQGSESIDNAQPLGTVYEGFNLLTPKFRAQFTTTGESGLYFFLPAKQLDNTEIVINYTEENGSIYKYVIPAGSNASSTDSSGIAISVNRMGGYFYCVHTQLGMVRFFPASGISNNLEVIASKTRPEGRDKICSMRFCTWFGSDRSSYNGGTRLFVSGHPLFPNLVHWSDVNNLLYFPENNFVYIGDSGQAVTTFAKQGEKLVIFKEREIYSASFVSGSRTAKALPDGTIVDATANSAQFPVSQLHPFIGCDCPGTLQLCDNRLVWADSSGRVYALAATNQYSESNVRLISAGVGHLLSQCGADALRSSLSCDYKGHYMLLVDNEVFLFDYSDSGYIAYLQNSSRTPAVPWMRWDFAVEFKPDFAMSTGESIILSGTLRVDGTEGTVQVRFSEGEDYLVSISDEMISTVPAPVAFMMQTSLLDFDHPERFKDIHPLYLEFGDTPDGRVSVLYLNEQGQSDGMEEMEPGCAGMIRLTPNAKHVRRFGFRLQGNGRISVGSMILHYRLYGKGIR